MAVSKAVWVFGAIALAGVLLYAVGVLALYWLQGRWVYPGERSTAAMPLNVDPRFVWLSLVTADGMRLVCRYCPPTSKSLSVLLFHGNGEDLRQRSAIAERLADEGYAVLQAAYRGFAGNPGRPSERGLYEDGRTALRFLHGIGLPVAIHGYSLGSGVAVQLASEETCAALILEAPFTSVVAVAQARLPWLPVRRLVRDRYDSLAKISQVSAPTLIYGGLADRVIPPAHFRQLFERANAPRQLLMLPQAGHLDAWQAGGEAAVIAFLAALARSP